MVLTGSRTPSGSVVPWSWTMPRPGAAALLAIGASLRIVAYLSNRGYWMAEMSLHANIAHGPIFALTGPLDHLQIVPPLFLVIERAILRILGDHRYALRLAPLLGGLASLVLMDAVARRLWPGRAALMALALFALSDEQVYYSTELKPYGTDVTVALAILLTTLGVRSQGLTTRLAVALLSIGAIATWFSFTAIFMLAASGVVLAVEATVARRWRSLAALVAIGSTWLASFAGSWIATRTQIGPDRSLWTFWDFAFPPPFAMDPAWIPRRLLFFFISPLDFGGPWPVDPRLAALPAVACGLAGLVWIVSRKPASAALLLLPGALVILAATLRVYPFHGRLAMFLVPSFYMLIAAGADLIWNRSGRRAVGVVLIGALFLNSTLLDLHHLTWEKHDRFDLNPRGDRRPVWMSPDMFFSSPRYPHPGETLSTK
ncbi:MAG: hypothetical protein JWN86_3115 [Planctomycetota bacterium]|nr:hypothetical protein [Planctomycetota bacterium]